MYRVYSYLLTAECTMCLMLIFISFLPRAARNPIKHIISKLELPYGGQASIIASRRPSARNIRPAGRYKPWCKSLPSMARSMGRRLARGVLLWPELGLGWSIVPLTSKELFDPLENMMARRRVNATTRILARKVGRQKVSHCCFSSMTIFLS